MRGIKIKTIKILMCLILLISAFSCFKKKDELIDKHRIYYEIFVRSFADSNNDGIGDLKGITIKLPELKELGVEALWLSPIFKSNSYHKYDVVDYLEIDKEYGTLDDLKELVKKAHELDMKIIIDFPINHTSYEHKWFKDARENKDSKYRNYYNIISKDDPKYNKDLKILGGASWHKLNEDELYFGIFWEKMPDLNFANKEVRKEIIDYAKYYIKETDLDGYRLDAAMHIFAYGEHAKGTIKPYEENIKWWEEFRSELKKVKKDIYLIGEAWSDRNTVSKYFKVFDSNFNFEIAEKLMPYALSSKNSEKITDELDKIYKLYEKVNEKYIDAPFIANHDQDRIASRIDNIDVLKLNASILLTLPGSPFIYYGEELGMKGRKPDEYIRLPYLWNDEYEASYIKSDENKDVKDFYSQKQDENSLLSHYIKWIKIRKENEEIKYGKYEPIILDNKSVFAYNMKYKNKKKTIVHNLSDNEQEIMINNEKIVLKAYESKVIN